MRILHTVAPGKIGGLEEVVLRLCSGLRSRGHDVSVLSVHDASPGAHPFVDALRRDARVPVEIVVVPPRGYLSEVRRVRAFCEARPPEILHTHGFRPCVLHPLAVRRAPVARVATLHGFTGGGGRKGRVYEWLQVRAVARMDAAVAVSDPLAARLRSEGVPGEILHVVRNAWEPRLPAVPPSEARAAFGVGPDALHIGWIGRLSREKGPDVLVEALGMVKGLPDLAVSFVGEGPLAAELRRRARELGLDRVHFHGSVPDAGRLFGGFDTVVLSSRTEGTPIVLLEAMGAKVPVIATAVGGIPDVVDAQTALLVPSEDPASLARAIETFARERAAALERAGRARQVLADSFAVEPWLARHESIYREALERRRG